MTKSNAGIRTTRSMAHEAAGDRGLPPFSRPQKHESLSDVKLQAAWNMVRGMEVLSFCDWPGHNSLVLFCGGCNLRCPTCHNGELAWHHDELPALSRSRVLAMLAERKRWLDGIVITGGEPTCVSGLELLLQDLSRLGLPIKLDSNGQKPGVLESLLHTELVEQFFIDVKGPWRLYPHLTGQCVSSEHARSNMERVFALAQQRPESFVFRMTRVPLLDDADVEEARAQLPEGFTLKMQKYHEPRRTYAQADQETGRLRGDLVA